MNKSSRSPSANDVLIISDEIHSDIILKVTLSMSLTSFDYETRSST
ncbi:hypothetical protein O9992_22750 [Vibrio lentus]|nr:hypothetical protein [Vibrio lentus]